MPAQGRDTASRAKNGDSQGTRHPPPPPAGDDAPLIWEPAWMSCWHCWSQLSPEHPKQPCNGSEKVREKDSDSGTTKEERANTSGPERMKRQEKDVILLSLARGKVRSRMVNESWLSAARAINGWRQQRWVRGCAAESLGAADGSCGCTQLSLKGFLPGGQTRCTELSC